MVMEDMDRMVQTAGAGALPPAAEQPGHEGQRWQQQEAGPGPGEWDGGQPILVASPKANPGSAVRDGARHVQTKLRGALSIAEIQRGDHRGSRLQGLHLETPAAAIRQRFHGPEPQWAQAILHGRAGQGGFQWIVLAEFQHLQFTEI